MPKGAPLDLRELLHAATDLQAELKEAHLLAASALMHSVIRAIRNREPEPTSED